VVDPTGQFIDQRDGSTIRRDDVSIRRDDSPRVPVDWSMSSARSGRFDW